MFILPIKCIGEIAHVVGLSVKLNGKTHSSSVISPPVLHS